MGSPDLSETVGGYGAGGNISTGYPGTTLTEHPKPVWKMGHLHRDTGVTLFVKDVVTGCIKKCWNKPSERSFVTHLDLFMYLLFVSGIFENNI
jgi:hypothetical protein